MGDGKAKRRIPSQERPLRKKHGGAARPPPAEPRNGTSGVTGVENPDGEPDHGTGNA